MQFVGHTQISVRNRQPPICNKNLHQQKSIIDFLKSILARADLCYRSTVGDCRFRNAGKSMKPPSMAHSAVKVDAAHRRHANEAAARRVKTLSPSSGSGSGL